MCGKKTPVLQFAAVCIMALALVTGVAAQGVVEPSDAFPVPGRLYVAEGPIHYSRIQTEILSMSLSSGVLDPISPTTLPGGTYELDSFFDVFVELSIEGGPVGMARLSGPVGFEIVVPDEPFGEAGTFDTEIVSMSLRGSAGGPFGQMPVEIRENPELPSPGRTTITRLDDGQWQVDSFFDVFTELSIDGGQTWVPAEAPIRIVVTPARVGRFDVVVEGNSRQWNLLNPQLSIGDAWSEPLTGRQWFDYPQEEPLTDPQGNVEQGPFGATWWNEWWYDDPYDPERIKIISLSFNYTRTDPAVGNGFVVITVNWSTTDWSLNPPPGIDPSRQPPLSDFDPANPSVAWVGRMQLLTFPLDDNNPEGTFQLPDFRLPVPYNPEWVSIDVRGYNFTINGGRFVHECVPDPDLPPEILDSTFQQLDWVGPFTPTIDSAWGRVQVEYNKPAGIYYYNLAVDTDGTGLKWIVMNRSIETPGGPRTLTTYFDLGVEPGTDVPVLDYVSSLDSAPLPLSSGGPTGTVQNVPVADLSFQVGIDGAPPGAPGKPAPDPKPGLDKNVSESGVLPDLGKFVNQPQKPNQCAPGAISNSLKYLQARGKIPTTLPTSISNVGAVIGTDKDGTPANWPTKKKEHYKKHVTTRFIEAPLTLAKVRDLIKQLKDGQDIEVDLEGHVEVLAGLRLKKDGTVDFDLFDDNQTDDKSDPMHTSPLTTDGTDQFIDGMKLERFVVECPVEQTTVCQSSFSLNSFMEWIAALEGHECGHIIPMTPDEWQLYWGLWQNPALIQNPDLPYPHTEFVPPQVYPYEGDGNPDDPQGWPDDAGLVMAWGNPEFAAASPEQASAWKYKYGIDPDLSNSIITVVVTAPQFGPNGQINQVSLGLETPPAGGGLVRSWYWNCGPVGSGAPIEWGVPTTIKIDTSLTGITAATPTATNYLNVPGFNITNVQWIIVDENGTWVGPPVPAPGPGGAPVFMWNYCGARDLS